MWAEYGPARDERARGQNSINNAQVPSLTFLSIILHIFDLRETERENSFLLYCKWQSH